MPRGLTYRGSSLVGRVKLAPSQSGRLIRAYADPHSTRKPTHGSNRQLPPKKFEPCYPIRIVVDALLKSVKRRQTTRFSGQKRQSFASHGSSKGYVIVTSYHRKISRSTFSPNGLLEEKSGRLDLNQRPQRPERCALAKLSYAPPPNATGRRRRPAKTQAGRHRSALLLVTVSLATLVTLVFRDSALTALPTARQG